MNICIYIHKYIRVPIYCLLSPFNVTCVNVFRADHLASENQLVCSYLGMPTSPVLRFTHLPLVLNTLCWSPCDAKKFLEDREKLMRPNSTHTKKCHPNCISCSSKSHNVSFSLMKIFTVFSQEFSSFLHKYIHLLFYLGSSFNAL